MLRRHSSINASSSPSPPGSRVRLLILARGLPRLTTVVQPDHHIRTGRSVVASSVSANQGLMPSTDLLAQSATENFDLCRNALARQEKYWLGAGWIGALAGRKGAQASRTSIKTATAGLNTFVSEAEMVRAPSFQLFMHRLTTISTHKGHLPATGCANRRRSPTARIRQ